MSAKRAQAKVGDRADETSRREQRRGLLRWGLTTAIIVLPVLILAYCLLQSNISSWWGLSALALALALLIVIFLFYLPQEIKEWLIEHGLIATGIILTLLLAIALLLWTVVNVAWSADEGLARQQQAALPADADLSVTVAYPQVALLDDPDSELTVTFARTDADALARQPVVITVTPGDGLTFPDAPGVPDRTFNAELGPGRPDTVRIPLVNDGSFAGLRDGGHTVSTQVVIGGQDMANPLELTVATEGRRGLALRHFVNSTVNEASPLIFLLLLILPGLATLGQKIVDERFGELKERRRKEFEAHSDEFRQYLRLGQLDNAADTLKTMKRHAYAHEQEGKGVIELANVLLEFAHLRAPAALPNGDNASKPSWWQRLAKWLAATAMAGQPEAVASPTPPAQPDNNPAPATPTTLTAGQSAAPPEAPVEPDDNPALAAPGDDPAQDNHRVLEMGLRWPDEFVAAYLSARESLADKKDEQFQKLLDKARERLQENPPALNDKSLQDRLAASLATDFHHSQAAAGAGQPIQPPITVMATPFFSDRAEADLTFLFGIREEENAFLARPQWTREFNTIAGSRLIVGEEGSGRTALARWIYNKPDTQHTKIWLAGEARPRQFAEALVETLFTLVRKEPKLLDTLNIGQRNILADLLLAYLSYGRALHLVEEAQKQQASLPLQRLRRALQDRALPPTPAPAVVNRGELGPTAGEIRLLGDMWRAIDLPQPVFIADIRRGRRRNVAQLTELVDNWHTAGASFVLFVPGPPDGERGEAGKPRARLEPLLLDIALKPLTWSADDIYMMVQKRWVAFETRAGLGGDIVLRGRPDSFIDRFEGGRAAVDRLIEASKRQTTTGGTGDHSPRRFMALWRKAVEDQPYRNAKVTTKAVAEAVTWGGKQWPT